MNSAVSKQDVSVCTGHHDQRHTPKPRMRVAYLRPAKITTDPGQCLLHPFIYMLSSWSGSQPGWISAVLLEMVAPPGPKGTV